MNSVLNRFKAILGNRWVKWLAAPAAVLAVLGTVTGAGTLPPLINLAAEPLYARGARAKPTLTLALSVEFPTVGAQYVDVPNTSQDSSYSPATEYIGYFDPESCYDYVDAPTETRPAGVTLADYKRFDRIGDALREPESGGKALSRRICGGQGFSGNFMNWAGSSAIDILRLGLSGGDRVVDTSIDAGGLKSGLTVLQRAVLPIGFWNSNNFPSKKLLASLAAGAVPAKLLKTTAGSDWAGDVFVASCANRLHFGTARAGSCASPGTNGNLGVKVGAVPLTGPYAGVLPSDFVDMVADGGSFTTTASKQVAYGAGTQWAIRTLAAGTIACSTANFGDPAVGAAKRCLVRDPVASPEGPGVTADGFMYARVRVCESNASGLLDRRTKFCQQYSSGAYKPVGNLQKYSDQLRVSAFGYLNDSAGNPNERYGGVLRAPMKYVGPKTFNDNFALLAGTNPVQEWNEVSGELIANPGGATEGRSGVINYLNQFGRTGATQGVYKSYDPVGELYYEALRYLQGLPPTADATAGMTTAMKDGFPVYSTWADPHPAVSGMSDYACVRNNIVAIGDVNTHNDKQIPGNTRTSAGNDKARAASEAGNEPNFVEWTKVVGGFESNNPITYTDGRGQVQTTSNPNPANSALWGMENKNIGADQAAYYMAGMAYWANTHDIRGVGWTADPAKQRPGMRVTTYVLDVNEYGQQTAQSVHKNNQFFLTSKYGGFRDTTGTGNPFKVNAPGSTASAPIYSSSNENWESPTTPGDAKNYYLSSSARGVLNALDQIFEKIATEANSIAGGAISTQRIDSVENYIYQAQFDPSDWSGDVVAHPVSSSASGVVTVGGTSKAAWISVAELMGKRAVSSRKIFVGPETSSGSAAEFAWSASLAEYVKLAMKTPLGSTSATDTDVVGQQRLDYLRGERTLETSPVTFRKRNKLLGDIVNSGIAYSGALPPRFAGSSFGSFYADNKDRKKALFVGANDGMLHAFDVASGEELFAYIPSWVVPRLVALTSPSYVHQSYVDGSPVVGEAKVGDAWKTVLVSGTGGGGQGVFALDVTNPDPGAAGTSRFGADKVLWEFSDKDDADLGNVMGRPQILPFRTSVGGTPKYFALVASGVNNHAPDGRASANGAAALFLLDLSKAPGAAWSLGTNYHKLVFPAPLTTIASGMINFSTRLDLQGNVSIIYAGDLQGNLWKLDMAKASPGSADYWTVDKLSAFVSAGKAIPMFIAQDATLPTPLRQPISMEPTLVFGANRSVIVSFGTGKFLDVADSTTASYQTQSVYAVLDDASTAIDTAGSAIAGRAKLRPASFAAGTVTVAPFVWGRPADGDATVRAGWYFDLPEALSRGERQVSGFANLAGKIIFGSVIPALNSCDDGSGNLYVIDLQTGNGMSQVSTVGIFGEPLVTRVDDSSLILGISDSTGRRKQTIRHQVILQGSAGIAAPIGQSTLEQLTVGRLSWRELSNYQELRKAP